jgi:cobalt-zinc-cadmium resistance protein CzcA
MARTYAYALIGALIATFTVSPVLSSLLLPKQVSEIETIFVRAIRKIYTPVLEFSLAHRWILVAVGLGFLAATGSLIPYLGNEFLPTLEEGNF